MDLPEGKKIAPHPEMWEVEELRAEILMLREALAINSPPKKLNSVLLAANEKLVTATCGALDREAQSQAHNNQLEELVAMLAHEIRNPLAAVSGAAQILGRFQNALPQLPRLHEIITRQTAYVARIVEDLLDASRVSNGKIRVKKELLNLEDVIEAALETCKPVVERFGHTLAIKKSDSPMFVEGDPVRLSQVFSNLLTNASKFMNNGGLITIGMETAGSNVIVTIQDNGVGMSEEMLEVIFQLFTQATPTLDRTQGGLGIGLSLVRSILSLHNGTVKAESDGIGKGSVFTVKLPLAPTNVMSAEKPDGLCTTESQRILIIDDNYDAMEMLSDLLKFEGHSVDLAKDGLSGLNAAKSNTYDVIICDIGLPEIDGFEVASQYIASEPAVRPKLIALSGYDQPHYRAQALESGFDHYLVKPVSLADLSTHIRNH